MIQINMFLPDMILKIFDSFLNLNLSKKHILGLKNNNKRQTYKIYFKMCMAPVDKTPIKYLAVCP